MPNYWPLSKNTGFCRGGCGGTLGSVWIGGKALTGVGRVTT